MQKSEYYENHFWFSRPTVLPDQGYTEHKISFLKKYDWVSSKVTTNFGVFFTSLAPLHYCASVRSKVLVSKCEVRTFTRTGNRCQAESIPRPNLGKI